MSENWKKKLTKPKSPFRRKVIESKEAREERIKNLKPSAKFQDFSTIQWLRHRFNEDLIKKSIFSLLPNQGKPEIDENESPEDKHKRILMEWLSTYAKPKDKYKYLDIRAKYFFNEKTFEKILKLKQIFLDFDEDGSRKMEIDEMEDMFNKNNIKTGVKDLVSLFFKDKNIKEKEIMSLYLDFYQFMLFALTQDQEFRFFMRKIKENYKKEGLKDEEKNFLPMNFNLVLDYFIIKGKERDNIESIEKSIKEMNKIIKGADNDNDNDIDKKDNEENRIEESKEDKEDENNKENLGHKDDDDDKEESQSNSEPLSYEEQLEKINFNTIIENFKNLFRISEDSNQDMQDKQKTKKRGTVGNSATNLISYRSSNKNIIINSRTDLMKEPNSGFNTPRDNEYNENKNTIFTDIVTNKILVKDIDTLNYNNYKKFHSLKLAFSETKKNINENNYFNYAINSSRTTKKHIQLINKNSNNNNYISSQKLPTIDTAYNTISKKSCKKENRYSSIFGSDHDTTSRTHKINKRIKNDYIPSDFLK